MIIQAMTVLNASTPFALPAGVARLTHWGVIQLHGADAAKFIHGQLTQDFSLLGSDQARLAAFCNAKGRMQASFVGFKASDGDIFLLCSKDLLAPTLKRLSMFVMRAKVQLSDVSDSYAIWGLSGDATKTTAAPHDQAWSKADLADGTAITLYPAGPTKRQLWVSPVDAPQPEGAAMSLQTWQWGEVISGIATVTQPVYEAFVPQMLNYESVGGVNFKKGCYPGQEVVARSQFRGTLKRRTYLAHTTAELSPGQDVTVAEDSDSVVGQVVQAAACPAGGYDALVVLQTAHQDAELAVAGARLTLQPLPYPLLEDI